MTSEGIIKCRRGFRPIAALVAALVALLALTSPASAGEPRTILFIGNSFTQGANSAVLRYRPESVNDLNGEGVGGIPALFARFAEQAGQAWEVSHETRGGSTLGFHLNERREKIDAPWDVVVMQQYSVLDPERPGDPAQTAADAPALAQMFTRANPAVEVYLMAAWTRADQVYRPEGHWYGRPVAAMALDLRRAMDAIDAASAEIDGVIPVGEAWNRAMMRGIADPNPYDGRTFGAIDLWSYDQYHASAEGSYLEALVVFGHVTGIDPRVLGAEEKAAHELGIEPRIAEALQQVAAAQLGMI
ncbi:SGNH/GDSL hydrolase family protein [Pelagerythrobacter rhizovicinus]|uniref:PEP-CTERM sorting domain-containing protein n=1 Tax=Pelagerythrobacter rhizovicinus TaxID=2268576 RepID=A0A4Q2KN18_9SPHN|nr:SGNH/GDSL hydrolase family protein [Pelagerythrobacter rhizovicinus]RXZ65919.1 PEP-CTERM sorting domain-containing protein [Pelagerythrobacter rhizovicinus]